MKAKLLYIVIGGLLFYSVIATVQAVSLHIRIAGLQKLPSIKDIQCRIGAKPDGIIGRETIEKRGAAICQQYADEYINNRTMGIEE